MASITYELYDGMPAIHKRIELHATSQACIERPSKARTPPHGPEKGCFTLGGMSMERLQLAPRLLGVPHVDENWQYLQGSRLSVFSDLTRPGVAYLLDIRYIAIAHSLHIRYIF